MEPLPIACSLGTHDFETRRREWAAVLADAISRTTIPGGVAIRFPARADVTEPVRDLIAKEQACCGWMSMTLANDGSEEVLSITNDEALGEHQIVEWFG